MRDTAAVAAPPDPLERVGLIALFGVAGALQFSIAAAQILLGIAALVLAGSCSPPARRGSRSPRFFWPLLAYAAITLVSAAFSSDPAASFVDSKQLALFLIVPLTYRSPLGPAA